MKILTIKAGRIKLSDLVNCLENGYAVTWETTSENIGNGPTTTWWVVNLPISDFNDSDVTMLTNTIVEMKVGTHFPEAYITTARERMISEAYNITANQVVPETTL